MTIKLRLRSSSGRGALESIWWNLPWRGEISSSTSCSNGAEFCCAALLRLRRTSNASSPRSAAHRCHTSPRTHRVGGVYTSTEYPRAFAIFPHNENSYQRTFPLFLGFHCTLPATQGGETTLADCRRVLERIDRAIVDEFAARKVLYVRNFRPELGLPWQTAFQTSVPAEVEAHCRVNGSTAHWLSIEHLRTSTVLSPLLVHPHTGQRLWFSHVAFFHPSTLPADVRTALLASYAPEDLPNATFYGDGSPIEAEVMAEIANAYQHEELALAWQKQDVLLVDNARMAHGRRPFRGPREVLVCMTRAVERDGN